MFSVVWNVKWKFSGAEFTFTKQKHSEVNFKELQLGGLFCHDHLFLSRLLFHV